MKPWLELQVVRIAGGLLSGINKFPDFSTHNQSHNIFRLHKLAGAHEELERAILVGDAASLPSAVSRFKAMQFEAAELAQVRQLLEDEASEAGGTATETFH